MTLENQVVSLDLAKRLKELGVGQDSVFFWVNSKDREKSKLPPIPRNKTLFGMENTGNYAHQELMWSRIASAFTVAELGEMLKDQLRLPNFNGKNWQFYTEHTEQGWLRKTGGKTEADARAKMLIYLLENKLIQL